MQFTDTHCHITLPQFDSDRQVVIQRAIDLGLTKLLIPGIDLSNSMDGVRLCAKYPKELFAAVGIHPNDIDASSIDALKQLRSLIQQKNVVAIGEIGLDYYRNSSPIELQKEYFISQLDIAAEFNLPVCIHCRDSMKGILEILEMWKIKNTHYFARREFIGVFHSFFGTLDDARKIVELGFMLGISGPITYPKNVSLLHTVQEIGIENLLIETDSPFLSPQKMRGKRNEPENVIHVIDKLTGIFNLAREKVSEITGSNASCLFGW